MKKESRACMKIAISRDFCCLDSAKSPSGSPPTSTYAVGTRWEAAITKKPRLHVAIATTLATLATAPKSQKAVLSRDAPTASLPA